MRGSVHDFTCVRRRRGRKEGRKEGREIATDSRKPDFIGRTSAAGEKEVEKAADRPTKPTRVTIY